MQRRAYQTVERDRRPSGDSEDRVEAGEEGTGGVEGRKRRKRLRTGSADDDEDRYEMEGDKEKAHDPYDAGSGKNATRLRLYDAPPTCFAIKYTSSRDAPP